MFWFDYLASDEPQQRLNEFAEEQGTQKHERSARPVVHGEGILEVEDGKDDAKELPQSDDQRHCQGGTLRRENVHRTNADVPVHGRVKDSKQTKSSSKQYAVEPLLKDSSEIRTPLQFLRYAVFCAQINL